MAQWLDRIKFGDGHDGSPSVTGIVNTYASCTGTIGEYTLTTSLSASEGDVIFIHQSQSTGYGNNEINYVLHDSGSSLTLAYPLTYTYVSGAQAVKMPQYTTGTLSGAVIGEAWGGSHGGAIPIMCNGVLTVTGSISINGAAGAKYVSSGARSGGGVGGGFRGGNGYNYNSGGWQCATQGEGYNGYGSVANAANGNGGGASWTDDWGGGAGGGNGSEGGKGYKTGNQNNDYGFPGLTAGNANLTNMVFGGGGGGGTKAYSYYVGAGGAGGGIIFIIAKQLIVSGSITANGGNGAFDSDLASGGGCGGAGAGGSILLKVQSASLGSGLVTANGGLGGNIDRKSGNGGDGRIEVDYLTSYSGYSVPAFNYTNNTNLKSAIYGGMI